MKHNQFTNRWTEELDNMLIKDYYSIEISVLAKKMNRTESSLRSRATKLGICKHRILNLSHLEETKRLVSEGYKLSEISKILGFKSCSLSQFCKRNGYDIWSQYKDSFAPRSSQARTYRVKKALPKICEICGFDRLIEIAHIIPAKLHGPLVPWNCLALCPNHHRLFDYNKLTKYELSIIDLRLKEAKSKFFEVIDLEKIKKLLCSTSGVEYPQRLKHQVETLFSAEIKRIA